MTTRRSQKTGHLRSNIPAGAPPRRRQSPKPPRTIHPPAPRGSAPPYRQPARQVARLIDVSDKSLADVLDSLLNQGVVLNADVILALANVDLVYIRLSALICAADRLGPGEKIR